MANIEQPRHRIAAFVSDLVVPTAFQSSEVNNIANHPKLRRVLTATQRLCNATEAAGGTLAATGLVKTGAIVYAAGRGASFLAEQTARIVNG